MKTGFDDYIESLDNKAKEEYLDNNNSRLNIDIDYHKVEYDLGWLEKTEATIEYLDKIVRNPRRFISQEEEIVPVEKSKSVTLESIKHLATHTNLIQDFDLKTHKITPSKVLNINKEESFDIYENRFIYSLLNNTIAFVMRRKKIMADGAVSKNNRNYTYKAKSKIGHEVIEADINFKSSLAESSTSGLTVNERIDKVLMILSDFMRSAFIKDLMSANVLPVKSPIRKTNVILKNPNFQKALELWEFVERYDVKEKVEEDEKKNYDETGITKEEMDNACLLQYLILTKDTKKELNDNKISKYYIKKVVTDFIENNHNVNINDFKKLVNQEFRKYYLNKKKIENKILNLYKKQFTKFFTSNKKLVGSLRI